MDTNLIKRGVKRTYEIRPVRLSVKGGRTFHKVPLPPVSLFVVI